MNVRERRSLLNGFQYCQATVPWDIQVKNNVAVPLSAPRGDNLINASFGSASTPPGALINVGS